MRIKFFAMTALASGALALGAPMAKATPLSKPALDNGVVEAHAVRVCDDQGDCWFSYRHPHSRYWDEERRGERYHDRFDDRYGRAPHDDYDRNFDRDRDMDRDRDDRRGQNVDKDRDGQRSARDETRSGKEYRGAKESGAKERGGRSSSGGTTKEPGQTQTQGQGKKD